MLHLRFGTALGPCLLAWSPAGLRALRFLGGEDLVAPEAAPAPAWVAAAAARITDHLAGRPADLAALPLDLTGLTPFQRAVAEVLRTTSPGDRVTYGEIALRLGRPGAARAVGRAVAANPLLLLVPCHRVWAKDGPGGHSAFGSPEILCALRELERPDTGTDATPAAR